MLTRLLSTKLYPPPVRPDQLDRDHLRQRLNDGLLPGCRLILVSAPAGYGKSTLIAGWAAGLDHTAWLTLDEGDNDPARFFTYLIAACQQLNPDFGVGLHSLLATPQMPPVEELAAEWINDLALLPGPFVLVLDDFQFLREPRLAATLEFLVEHLPPHARLAITTREDPSLPLARLRARREMVELRGAELRFSPEETSRFLQTAAGQSAPSPALVDALQARTEGWIAGLQLAALALQTAGAPDRPDGLPDGEVENFIADFSGSHRYIIDYLVDEVLRRQPPEIRSFLRQTSILDTFNAPLCAALLSETPTEPTTTQSILERIERANLFLIPLDGERVWYRYHRLFADVLRSGLTEEEEGRLHRKASAWHAAQGNLPQAIHHLLAARDWQPAAALIGQTAGRVLEEGGLTTILNWIDRLPPEVVRAAPDLSIYQIFSLLFAGHIHRALELLPAVSANVQALDPTDPANRLVMGRLLATQAWLVLAQGSAEALGLALRAIEYLGDQDPYFRAIALIPAGTGYLMDSRLEESTRAFEEAVALAEVNRQPFATLVSLANLLFNLMDLNRLRQARELCTAALARYVDRRGRPLPIVGIIYIPLAVLHLEADELEEAERYARQGLELCSRLFASAMMGGDAEAVLAETAFARGDHAQAYDIIHQAQSFASQRGLKNLALRAEYLEQSLRLQAGDIDSAEGWVSAFGEIDQFSQPRQESLLRLKARVAIARERPREALEFLATIAPRLRASGFQARLVDVQILQAVAHAAAGEMDSSERCLEQALQAAAPENFRKPFLREIYRLAPLLPKVRAVAPAFVDALLSAVEPLPVQSQATAAQRSLTAAQRLSTASDQLPEPLSETERTILRLVVAGRSNAEIAEALYITVGTAKWHLHNILGKLGVANRTQAAAKARDLDLI